MAIHAVDLAIYRGRLQQIVDEMDLVQTKAAFSPAITEMWDRANAIIDPVKLEVVMQGTTGLPIFVATMQAAARTCMHVLGSDLRPGDVVMMNDPYGGGTHLQDMKMLRPVFVDSTLVALLISTGHLIDIGGASPGAFDPAAVSIFQEGLRLPPIFVARDHEIRSDVLDMILGNTRLKAQQFGDLRAQMNALEVGERRLLALIGERGCSHFAEVVTELADRSEEQMRTYLHQIPNGTYAFSDVVETDNGDLDIKMALEVTDYEVTVSFEGTSGAHDSAMNLAEHTTVTSVLAAFKHLFPDVPISGGCFRPFAFSFPADCFLAAELPRAVGGYPEGAERVMDAVIGALAVALPDVASGATFGTSAAVTLAGTKDGRYFATIFPMSGGYGGSAGSDGLVHAPTAIGLARFHRLEAAEHDYPVLWECLELRPDSAGAGQWRGGAGSVMRFRVTEPVTLSVLGDRSRHHPFGVAGGGAAARFEFRVTNGDESYGGPEVNALPTTALLPGAVVELRSPGGGGYGDAARRDPRLVDADIRDGIVTPAAGCAGGQS